MEEPRVVTSFDSFTRALETADIDRALESNSSDTPAIRVPVEVRFTVSDPFLAYRRARTDDWGVYLETTGGQPGWGYFGVDPIERLTVSADAVPRSDDVPPRGESSSATSSSTTANSGRHQTDGSPTGGTSPTLSSLEGIVDGTTLVRGECDVPFPCGIAGWLSYDVARELEQLPESARNDRELPRLEAGVYDRIAAWEEPVDGDVTMRITACPIVDGLDGSVLRDDVHEVTDPATRIDFRNDSVDGTDLSPIEALEAAYHRGKERAMELANAIQSGDPSVGEPPVETAEATFQSQCGRDAFAERVRRVKRYIRDGDTFQANISQRLVAPAAVHPIDVYDALRDVNPAPFSGLCEFRSVDLLSASPELLLERENRSIRTEPIAGTRPRGDTAERDLVLETELRTDEKERAEHAMLVDLERNDLGKVCEYGSVTVEEYRRVDRYSEVMHLVSNVVGRLPAGVTLGDSIAAVFPGGTITGAPKPRTMEIIDEVEATRRGPYTGSMALFGFDGRTTMNIVIRTLVRYDDEYHLRVGAGIVSDSDPNAEYDETLDKGRALVTAVDEALGERVSLRLATNSPTVTSESPSNTVRASSEDQSNGSSNSSTGTDRQ